jgi:hypothetical protein
MSSVRIPPRKPTKPFKTPPPHLTVTKTVPMPTKLQTSTNKIPMVSTKKHPVTHKIPPRPKCGGGVLNGLVGFLGGILTVVVVIML